MPEETRKAKATEPTQAAARPQAPLAATQATLEAAKDKAAKGEVVKGEETTLDAQARAAQPVSLPRAPAKATPAHRVLPAMRLQAGMPEPTQAAARPERGLAWETVKATAAAKRVHQEAGLAAASAGVRAATMP
ncbi:hypothetical protein [Microvirga aerophila]|nr:hypothetical protein [Microvirga aerophila]